MISHRVNWQQTKWQNDWLLITIFPQSLPFHFTVYHIDTEKYIYAYKYSLDFKKTESELYCTESGFQTCLKINKKIFSFRDLMYFNICTSQVLPSCKEEPLVNFHIFWRANDSICWCRDHFGNSPRQNSSWAGEIWGTTSNSKTVVKRNRWGSNLGHFLQYQKLVFSKMST